MQIEGKIIRIGNTEQVSDRFKKRVIVIEHGDDADHMQKNALEFVQDRTALVDGYQVGQAVTVWFDINGRDWTSPTGDVKNFTTLKGWRITAVDSTPNPIPSEPPPLDAAQEIPKSAGEYTDEIPF